MPEGGATHCALADVIETTTIRKTRVRQNASEFLELNIQVFSFYTASRERTKKDLFWAIMFQVRNAPKL
jgi:hypothetical protein